MCQETLPRGKVQISRVNKTILFIFNYFALCIKEFPQRDFATFLDYSDKDNDTLHCNNTLPNNTFRNLNDALYFYLCHPLGCYTYKCK